MNVLPVSSTKTCVPFLYKNLISVAYKSSISVAFKLGLHLCCLRALYNTASSRLVASPVRLHLGLRPPIRLHLGLCLLQFGFISARGFSRSASRLHLGLCPPVRLHLGLCLLQFGFISVRGFSRSASRLHLGSWLLPFGFISACGFSRSASSRLVASPVRLYLGLWLLVPFAQTCTATVPFVQGRSASSRLVVPFVQGRSASPRLVASRTPCTLCTGPFGSFSACGFSYPLYTSCTRLLLGLWPLVPFVHSSPLYRQRVVRLVASRRSVLEKERRSQLLLSCSSSRPLCIAFAVRLQLYCV
ncbi:hypothetical protein AAC387_Pa05g1465 [Persea americana]